MAQAKRLNDNGKDYWDEPMVLTLTAEESRVLLCVLERVSGSPSISLRRVVDDITQAMMNVMGELSDTDSFPEDKLISGSIRCEDEDIPF